MTPAQRLNAWLDSVGDSVPATEADRHKPRPPFTPTPEPLVPLLRDVAAALEGYAEALLDMTTERDMWRAYSHDHEKGAA